MTIYPPEPGETHTNLKVILAVLSQEEPLSDLVQTIADRGSYLTIFVNDCLRALELTREIVPDLLLLDYNLLHPHGTTFIRQLRSHQALANVPTLVINTPTPSHELPLGGLHDIYLTKLSNTDELASAVQSLLPEPGEKKRWLCFSWEQRSFRQKGITVLWSLYFHHSNAPLFLYLFLST